jgi:hypothetical protein
MSKLKTCLAALASTAIGVLACGSDPSIDSPVVFGEGTTLFPDETITDWVSYAENLSRVRVLSEMPLDPNQSVVVNMEGYVPRAVEIVVEDTVWVSPLRAEATPSALSLTTLGWIRKGSTMAAAVAPNAARLEPGGSYFIPFVRYHNEKWGPLTPHCPFAAVGSPVATADVEKRGSNAVARELAGLSTDAIRARLEIAEPDPLARKHGQLPALERLRAVNAERSR